VEADALTLPLPMLIKMDTIHRKNLPTLHPGGK
jgi:hypothetical protein